MGQKYQTDVISPSRHTQKSSQHVRACATVDGAICSKNRKIVPCHGDSPNQGGKRPGGETGSLLLVQCVMRRRTGTSAPSALPVRLMAAKNFLSTNRKSIFLSFFLSFQWLIFKGCFDFFSPQLNTILSVGILLKYFRHKLLKFG